MCVGGAKGESSGRGKKTLLKFLKRKERFCLRVQMKVSLIFRKSRVPIFFGENNSLINLPNFFQDKYIYMYKSQLYGQKWVNSKWDFFFWTWLQPQSSSSSRGASAKSYFSFCRARLKLRAKQVCPSCDNLPEVKGLLRASGGSDAHYSYSLSEEMTTVTMSWLMTFTHSKFVPLSYKTFISPVAQVEIKERKKSKCDQRTE